MNTGMRHTFGTVKFLKYLILAYSIRIVNDEYSGPLIRVRKNSIERDILPDSNLELSENSGIVGENYTFGDFIINEDIFVSKIYDQSGKNNNAIQNNLNNQPLIALNGNIIKLNSKPSLLFSSVNPNFFYIENLNEDEANFTFCIVSKKDYNNVSGDNRNWTFDALNGRLLIDETPPIEAPSGLYFDGQHRGVSNLEKNQNINIILLKSPDKSKNLVNNLIKNENLGYDKKRLSNAFLGKSAAVDDHYLKGYLQEFLIYNYNINYESYYAEASQYFGITESNNSGIIVPLHYFKFDELSGNANDIISGNEMTITNDVLRTTSGKINNAFVFNSNQSYGEINKQILPFDDSDFAFNFYLKGVQGNDGGIVTAFGGADSGLRAGWRFNGSKFAFWRSKTYVYTSNANIDDNIFHTISVSRESGIVSVYIDGVLDGNYNESLGFQQDANTVIGAFKNAAAFLSETIIDEFSYYDRALTLAEIKELHNNNIGKTINLLERDIIVEMGQSNMEGRFGDTTNPEYPFISQRGYWFDGTNENNITTLRGNAQNGSHSTYFADKYLKLTSRKAVLIESADGGSGLTFTSDPSLNWANGGGLRNETETKVSSALAFYGKTQPKAGLWCQGERDAQEIDSNVNYTKADVKSAMQDLVNWWQTTYPGVPFFISELGDFSDGRNNQGWQDVRAVQNEIVAENANVFMAFTGAKDFGSQGFMGDSLHYSFEGNKLMGEAFAESINNNV